MKVFAVRRVPHVCNMACFPGLLAVGEGLQTLFKGFYGVAALAEDACQGFKRISRISQVDQYALHGLGRLYPRPYVNE